MLHMLKNTPMNSAQNTRRITAHCRASTFKRQRTAVLQTPPRPYRPGNCCWFGDFCTLGIGVVLERPLACVPRRNVYLWQRINRREEELLEVDKFQVLWYARPRKSGWWGRLCSLLPLLCEVPS